LSEKYSLKKDFNLQCIPEQYEYIADEIGLDNFFKLCKICGGSALYIPKPDFIKRKIRNKQIVKEFDGVNYKGLSKKYNITEAHVRRIVNEELFSKK